MVVQPTTRPSNVGTRGTTVPDTRPRHRLMVAAALSAAILAAGAAGIAVADRLGGSTPATPTVQQVGQNANQREGRVPVAAPAAPADPTANTREGRTPVLTGGAPGENANTREGRTESR
jgi:hypothetical protein